MRTHCRVASLVSQATLAFTLGLLAWSDRRTKGMAWLAWAAVLQTAVSGSLVRSASPLGIAGSILSPLVILLYFFFYMGLRWFAVRRNLRARSGPMALVLGMAAVLLAQRISPAAELLVTQAITLVLIGMTVRMLWSSRLLMLRVALRCCAVLLALRGALIFTQMVLMTTRSTAASGLNNEIRFALLVGMPLLLLSYLGLFVAETNRRLHDETRLDVLTGLRNRRALEEIAAREARRCAAEDIPLALLMMDLDHFKQLNDTWGHGLGDRALRTMGSVLLTVVGDGAVTARMGGEEFAVLLPGSEVDAATEIAERVRVAVEELRLVDGERAARFTVSVGVSVMLPGERTWTEMMTPRRRRALPRQARRPQPRRCGRAGRRRHDAPSAQALLVEEAPAAPPPGADAVALSEQALSASTPPACNSRSSAVARFTPSICIAIASFT